MSKTKQTEPTQEELGNFVAREVLTCQSVLVEELLKNGTLNYEDITNLQKTDEMLEDDGYETAEEKEKARDNGEDTQEIFEWWIVSNWLLEKLEAHGEPVLKTELGDWWGRTCTGQAILLDSVIETIYKEMRDFCAKI